MYLENQTTVAEPDEDNGITVHSATQFYDNVVHPVAAALGIHNNKVRDMPLHLYGIRGPRHSL
jgi:xanthine dehydrogenase molybdopterin-binding subunit B